MHKKIKTYSEFLPILEKIKENKQKIVHCHGVFDLLHPGHIRHLKLAKKQGDILVVSLTSDRFVNKGPGRPVFNEQLRIECIAALDCVDYVVLNDAADAVPAISKIKPDIYVKGSEYRQTEKDVTGKITQEIEAVEKEQGRIFFTDEIVYSSSSLLNQFFDPYPPGVQPFLRSLKKQYSSQDLIDMVEELSKLKVLVIGDAILDIYQYVEPLGQPSKGFHMAACCKEQEVFLGGSLIIANHLAEFSQNITLVTALGKQCPYRSWIQNKLNPKVQSIFFPSLEEKTLIKKRYLVQDGETLSKLFETYSSNQPILTEEDTQKMITYLEKTSGSYDLVLVSDFGNGFMNSSLIEAISNMSSFVALNTQCNSGNRGFNVVTHYAKANYISLNEPEARLAAHHQYHPIDQVAEILLNKLQASFLSITQGVQGVSCYSKEEKIHIPPLTMHSIDRVGAGDSYLALSSLALAKNYPLSVAAFFGSIAAALDIQIVGNREPIKKGSFLKFLIRLFK